MHFAHGGGSGSEKRRPLAHGRFLAVSRGGLTDVLLGTAFAVALVLNGCGGLVGENIPLEGNEIVYPGDSGRIATGGAGGATGGTGGVGGTDPTTTTTTGSGGAGGAGGTGGDPTGGTGGDPTGGTGGATGGTGGATGGTGGATGGTGGATGGTGGTGGATGGTGGTGGATGGTAGTGGATGGTGGATGGTGGATGGTGGATGGTAGTGGATGGTGGTGGGTGGTGGAGGTGGTSTTCSVSVTVTTASAGGQFAPRNIGAIWIANSSGTFVKTLAKWAQVRVQYLTAWNAASKANVVDAVTSATLSSHQTHSVKWNCTDVNKAQVADGAYKVYFELTDKDGTGPNTSVAFTKGPTGATVTPADASSFKSISVVFTP